MAEEGVADYGTAKQKAARQAGLVDAHLLPDNREIEAALREFQELYQSDDQPGERVACRDLRRIGREIERPSEPERERRVLRPDQ